MDKNNEIVKRLNKLESNQEKFMNAIICVVNDYMKKITERLDNQINRKWAVYDYYEGGIMADEIIMYIIGLIVRFTIGKSLYEEWAVLTHAQEEYLK